MEITEIINIIKKASMKVYKDLGYGLSEKAYQCALYEELRDYNLHTQQEYHISEYFFTSNNRKIEVSCLRIDIIVNDDIILELKTIENNIQKIDKKTNEIKIEDFYKTKEYLQCSRYKKLMKLSQCILINFGKKKLEFIKI
jgi:GxxExxY protein